MKWFFAVFFTVSFVFLTTFGVNCIYGYIFPIKYQEEVDFASGKFLLDKAIVYSVINIESNFNKDAISSKGAVGLMQIMPTTAKELAIDLGLSEYDLKNPQHNILLGSCYLSRLLKKFENVETALCAYNAGPTNVNNWLTNEKYSDNQQTLKEIPFLETKNYIAKFKTNFKYYKQKLK